MAIYSFVDARAQLKARTGHRTDLTDTDFDKFLNQAQLVLATNVKGLDVFDSFASPLLIPANATTVTIGVGGFNLTNFWAVESMRNLTIGQFMSRGGWNELSRLTTVPEGPQLRWLRRFNQFWFFTKQATVTTQVSINFRRLPVLGTLETPDEWFEHLLNIASIYVYPTIGRNKERDVLFQRLPQNLQLAVVNPTTPSMWESVNDENLSFYAER
jgi:hypothetical protein